MSLNQVQRALTNSEMYSDAAAAGAGYMAPFVGENLAENYLPFDLPSEAVGLITAAILMAYGPTSYATEMRLGASVYAAEQAAERVGIKSTVINMGA
jgi:hypothetical protein